MKTNPSLALVKGLLQLCLHCEAPASPAAPHCRGCLSHLLAGAPLSLTRLCAVRIP